MNMRPPLPRIPHRLVLGIALAHGGAWAYQPEPVNVPSPPTWMTELPGLADFSGQVAVTYAPQGPWSRHNDRNDDIRDPLVLREPAWFLHLRSPGLFSTENLIVPPERVRSLEISRMDRTVRYAATLVDKGRLAQSFSDALWVLCERAMTSPSARDCLRPRYTIQLRGLGGDGRLEHRITLPDDRSEVYGHREARYLSGASLSPVNDASLAQFNRSMETANAANAGHVAGICVVSKSVSTRQFIIEATQGVSGRCGQGSRLTIRAYQANGWLANQLCDSDKSIRTRGADVDEEIACVMTGRVLEPTLKFSGMSITLR